MQPIQLNEASAPPFSSSYGRIEAVTLTAPDLDAATKAYREALGQKEVGGGSVGKALAASWGAPAAAGRGMRLLRPPSGEPFWLRLVASPPWPQGPAPRRTHGWAALELTVRDGEALHARLAMDGRFRVLGAPAPLPGLPQIYPMQAEGPMGEVLYLNEIRGDLPDHDLPRAGCEVDHVFIAVLGAPDLDRAVGFYREELGFSSADRYEIPYGAINDAFGLPAETLHRLETTCVGRRLNVEVDQYPLEAAPRPCEAGGLPPAMAVVSFRVDDLSRFESRALGPRIMRAEAPYLGRPALTLKGDAGELVEVIAGDPAPDQL